jgi:hypothetical protein
MRRLRRSMQQRLPGPYDHWWNSSAATWRAKATQFSRCMAIRMLHHTQPPESHVGAAQRLPTIAAMWQNFTGRADREDWPAARRKPRRCTATAIRAVVSKDPSFYLIAVRPCLGATGGREGRSMSPRSSTSTLASR